MDQDELFQTISVIFHVFTFTLKMRTSLRPLIQQYNEFKFIGVTMNNWGSIRENSIVFSSFVI